ncbi:glycosyltransferase [Dietzia sp. DQ11-71]|nr:glycosyltransferase family 4 protein [Dietzia sp. DQ11-71]MBB1017366.1 glycosyltransferase [Dietzia sp. DQ11-71]
MVDTHGDRFQFNVITSDTDWGETTPLDVKTDEWLQRGKARVLYAQKRKPFSLYRALRSGAAVKPDFVYINSFLSPGFSILPVALSKIGYFGNAKIILAPRGEFGASALAIKARKKSLYLFVSRLLNLHSQIGWHASSATEANELKAFYPKADVKVRLNESLLPSKAIRRSIPCNSIVRLVFVSRISEIKGLTLLLEALAGVTQEVHLDIYGSAQVPSYLEKCQRLAAALPSNIRATFHGSVDNSQVRERFIEADAFFLPTEHENFGHAIAESLSAGCPVFIEDVTPWTSTIKNGGGQIVPTRTIGAWREALQDYCALSATERTALKESAADVYEQWRAENVGPSIFDLFAAGDQLSDSSSNSRSRKSR